MNESIRENDGLPRRPDGCNLGIWLRVLLAVNLGGLLVAFARAAPGRLGAEFLALTAMLEPVTLASLLAACASRRLLDRLAPAAVATVLVAGVMVLTALYHALFMTLTDDALWPALVWAALATLFLLAWFDLRARAHAPALAEARLLALTARIRPHFLFNSINAVLGVLRHDPRRAERALEEMADLFRALMRDHRALVPLSDELALARQYLDLEKLRLGERLQVLWEVTSCPEDTLVPPLMLQPLLENAVHHGIEPSGQPGLLRVRLAGSGGADGHLVIEITNPLSAGPGQPHGNRMALANIRERLMLHYDLEAHLETTERAGCHIVHIVIPNRQS